MERKPEKYLLTALGTGGPPLHRHCTRARHGAPRPAAPPSGSRVGCRHVAGLQDEARAHGAPHGAGPDAMKPGIVVYTALVAGLLCGPPAAGQLSKPHASDAQLDAASNKFLQRRASDDNPGVQTLSVPTLFCSQRTLNLAHSRRSR